MTIKLGAADLNYLLQQVNILNDYSQLTSPIDPNGVREVSGANNNLVGGFIVDPLTGNLVWTGGYETKTGLAVGNNVNADWGQADTDFLRLFQTDHPTNGTSYGITYDTVVQTAALDKNGLSYTDLNWIATFTPDVMGSIVVTGENTTGGTSPRTITQLIASSDVDPLSPTYNPAAAAAMMSLGGEPVDVANTVVGSAQTAFIPNPGVLGGATYNEFFVAFGQFFDHGLDFISKSGGYVLIPLSPNDPLYNSAASGEMANMMMLSRASLSNPPEDFVIDTLGNATLKVGVTPQFNNNTGLMIDQSQTYGSHESINVLVRQYDATGKPTGRLIDGSEDGSGSVNEMASWADMKVNAARIGIELIDTDVLDAPMIKADAVGRLLTQDVTDELNAKNAAAGLPALNSSLAFVPQSTWQYRSDETLTEMADRIGGGVTVTELAASDPFFRDGLGTVLKSNQAILADMGNGASPMGHDGTLLPAASELPDLTGLVLGIDYYDEAFLAQHKVSGDGRVNENIGLTAVHHVFHEEHNIQSNEIKLAAIRDAVSKLEVADATALDGLNGFGATDGWLATDITQADLAGLTSLSTATEIQAVADALIWDGEKIYQAARIITESEYNHVTIDQYMPTLYPALPEFVAYSADINLNVSLEFSQAVFRLGHSQLTEQIKLALPNASGNPGDPGYIPDDASTTQVDLFDAFLNPAAYDQYSAAGIISGLLNQQGNQLDEFVTSALQQSVVGVPLDLAALNIARGRDVGLPTLNELRQQAFEGLMQNTSNNSNGSGLAPYTSWSDFGGSMRNPESLVNFIAAYARDDLSGNDWGINEARAAYEAGTMTLQELRQTAQNLMDAFNDVGDARHEQALQFMQGGGTPVYNPYAPGNINGWVYTGGSGDLGFWDIDLWIGGLAEQPLFDGPLGTTFSLILLDFAQRMQDGDRFYYLYRMPIGHHLGDQIIGEQFADLIMRTTGLENIGDAFGYQTAAYYLDSGVDGVNDEFKTSVDANNSIHDYFNAIYEKLPDVTKNLVVANKSFEVDDLANDGSGPVQESTTYGNWLSQSPAGWTNTNGGTFAPTDTYVDPNGKVGSQVAYINGTGVLSQDIDTQLVEGATYSLSFKLGNRNDLPTSTLHAKLYAVGPTTLANPTGLTLLADYAVQNINDGWIDVSFDTSNPMTAYGPIDAAVSGQGLRVVFEKMGDATSEDVGATQILIDNVNLSVTEPGGSANDGHILVVGGTGNDFIKGALGDDYIYGDEGHDVIEGAQGNDHLYGGDGNDWITDYENDDFIHGGAGNDYISAGPGILDTVHGGEGDDEVHGGDGIDEVFGDDGDDILYGEGDTDLMEGGDGNDYIDGGDSVDEIFAGNGNDWLRGGVGDDHMNGGSGNDLMEGGGGPVANDGDRYFGDQGAVALPLIEFNGDGTIGNMDVASYENLKTGVNASLQTLNATGTNSNLLDSYAFVDGIVGSAAADRLEGGDVDAVATNGWNNQLIGGGGSDRIVGLGDDAGIVTNATVDANQNHYVDWIFGDAVVVRNNLWFDLQATQYYSTHGALDGATTSGVGLDFKEQWGGKDIGIIASQSTTGETRVVFSDTGELGHILGEDGVGTNDIDTAVYRGLRSEYDISQVEIDGVKVIRVEHATPAVNGDGTPIANDGVDYLLGVEKIEFGNGETIDLAPPELKLHTLDHAGTYVENFASTSYTADDVGVPTTFVWDENWVEVDPGNADVQITNGRLQFDSGTDNGDMITRAIDLSGLATGTKVTLSFDYEDDGVPSNTLVAEVWNSATSMWEQVADLAAGPSGTYSYSGQLTADQVGVASALRFRAVSGGFGSGDNIYIDNVQFSIDSPAITPAVNFEATFTEDGPAVAIASGPAITDGDTAMASATIVLTNAKQGDVLNANDVADGITSTVNTSVPGQITISLTGVASLATYQAAIQRVTFENTSQVPDTTPRTIEVTVNDGILDSNTATTTIAVNGVLDPVVAAADSIITNITSGTFNVPTWALLANDFGETALTVVAASEGTTNQSNFSIGAFTSGDLNVSVSKSTNENRTFAYTSSDGSSSASATASVRTDTNSITASNSGNINQILVGNGNSDRFEAGAGNDIVFAGAGDDTIVWNVGDGRDFVDGGSNTGTGDQFTANGNRNIETFRIYSMTDPVNAGLASILGTSFRPETKIVITRSVGLETAVVAELTNIEELTIDTVNVTAGSGVSGSSPGNDLVEVIGNFTGTGLNQNTITINANGGNVVVDISQMTSNEHVVLNTGGTYEIVSNGTNEVMVNGQSTGGSTTVTDATPIDTTPVDTTEGATQVIDQAPASVASPTIISGDAETIVGSAASDVIVGTDATRVVYADAGDDIIMTGNANTVVMAGAGADVVNSGDGNDIILGGEGGDTIDSGTGNDKVWGDAGNDVINAGDGDDQVYGGEGADEIHGGIGNDRVEGGAGADILFGDAGNDRFVFRSEADADGDTVADFQAGDVIDLSFIDANGSLNGNANFTLLSATAFTANGQLIVHFDANSNATVIEGNTDNDNATTEFRVTVDGNVEDLLLHQGSIIG